MSIFDDIITSKVRVKILDLFFSNLTEMYHVRGIVREIDEEINRIVEPDLNRFRLNLSGCDRRQPTQRTQRDRHTLIRRFHELNSDLVSP